MCNFLLKTKKCEHCIFYRIYQNVVSFSENKLTRLLYLDTKVITKILTDSQDLDSLNI